MKIRLILAATALLAASALGAHAADETMHGHNARWRADLRPWHGGYYYMDYGVPMALVVPPTAEWQTDYAWGVPASRMTRIDQQFQRPYPNGYWTPNGFLPAPGYPGDTRQFGVYYIRGPW